MSLQSAPFPARHIALRAPGIGLFSQLGGLLGALFWALLMVGGAYLGVVPPARDLIDDFGIRAAAQPVAGGHIEGKCRVRVVLASCEIELFASSPGVREVSRKVDYVFLDTPHIEKYRAVVVADPAQPQLLTTDLGLDKIWNRLITLLVLSPILLLLGIGGVAMIILAPGDMRRKRRLVRALSGNELRLGILRLEAWKRGTWTVVPYPPGAPGERTEWSAPGFPALLDPAQGLVLAVTAGDGSVAMPLDSELSFLVLTPEERKRLADWIGPERLAWRPPGFEAPGTRLRRLRRSAPVTLGIGLLLGAIAAVLAWLAFGEPGSGDFEQINLARSVAPHSERVRLTGVLQNQLRVQSVWTAGNTSHLEEYRPITGPGWQPGEPVQWLVKEVSMAAPVPETTSSRGTVIAAPLPADAREGFRKAGVVLAPTVRIIEPILEVNRYFDAEMAGLLVCAMISLPLVVLSIIGFVAGRRI
jgi:hypothetical protein